MTPKAPKAFPVYREGLLKVLSFFLASRALRWTSANKSKNKAKKRKEAKSKEYSNVESDLIDFGSC